MSASPQEPNPFWRALGSVVLLGFGISVATYCMNGAKEQRGERLVVWIAALGLVAGVFLWPVTVSFASGG